MWKLLAGILLCGLLCGCKSDNMMTSDLRTVCINGHVYIRSVTYLGDIVYTPLFAEGSDIPRLIQCRKKDNSYAEDYL